MRITSVQNPRIKAAAHLRDKRGRAEQGRFLIDGRREIRCALQGQFRILEIFWRPEYCSDPAGQQLMDQLRQTDAAVVEVTSPVFARLAYGERDEGLIVIAQPRYYELEQLALDECSLVAVLDRLEKPGNLGAILRTADAAGVDSVIVTDGATDVYNPNVVRSSLGAVFQIPVCCVAASDASGWLRQQGIRMYAARVEATHSYFSQNYLGPTAFILGSEAHGLSDEWSAEDIFGIHLPMLGGVDSLNVSVTAAVLLYEAVRQRRSASA